MIDMTAPQHVEPKLNNKVRFPSSMLTPRPRSSVEFNDQCQERDARYQRFSSSVSHKAHIPSLNESGTEKRFQCFHKINP